MCQFVLKKRCCLCFYLNFKKVKSHSLCKGFGSFSHIAVNKRKVMCAAELAVRSKKITDVFMWVKPAAVLSVS